MILVIASGILTTLLGAAFGCMVLELTMRALTHGLNEPGSKSLRAATVRRQMFRNGSPVRGSQFSK